MNDVVAEHRRNVLYNNPTSVAKRQREKAPRTPVAELQSRHVEERRGLTEDRRIAGEKLRWRQELEKTREHSIGPLHRALKMEARHARESQQHHRHFDEKEAALAKRHRTELEQAIAQHGMAP